MAQKLGFTEEKSTIISKLHAQVDLANEDLGSAQVMATNTSKTLADATIRHLQDESNKTAAHASFQLCEKLVDSARHAEKSSKSAVGQSETILKIVREQLEDAHTSALVIIDAAHQTLELTRLISKTKVTHKLLSDLLVVDVKNAEADAHSAVADAIDAVSASIAAAQSAILAQEFLKHTGDKTSALLDMLTGSNALKGKLDSYYKSTKDSPGTTKTEAAFKEAKKEVKEADDRLNRAKAHCSLILSAYNAAVAAVSSAA